MITAYAWRPWYALGPADANTPARDSTQVGSRRSPGERFAIFIDKPQAKLNKIRNFHIYLVYSSCRCYKLVYFLLALVYSFSVFLVDKGKSEAVEYPINRVKAYGMDEERPTMAGYGPFAIEALDPVSGKLHWVRVSRKQLRQQAGGVWAKLLNVQNLFHWCYRSPGTSGAD
jgi:hypothetical protein